MDPSFPPEAVPVAVPPKHPWYSWRRLGYNFLTLSLAVHLLLAVGAAYFVVQVTYPKKKSLAGPPAQSAPQHALEHKVSMAKAQRRSSAPAAVKRVVTTGLSRVSLPAMPAIPVDSAVTPMSMSGMTGQGLGSLGGGGGGSGGGGGGGGGPNFFGLHTGGQGLVGTFYDLKQTPSRQPTGMTVDLYGTKVIEFARGGFNTGLLSNYFKAGKPIYATRVFTPDIPAELGPAAFGVEKEVQPKMWIVHYKGVVVAPESATFHFCGMGDDVLMVRFNNRLVLDANWSAETNLVPGQKHYQADWHEPAKGFTIGADFPVDAGQAYPIEVVIGEQPGGRSALCLLIAKSGDHYSKDPKGGDIMPFFRTTADSNLPPPPPGSLGYAPHLNNGLVWKTQDNRADSSIFSH